MAIYRHDERKNNHYSNKDIDRTKSHLNYSLKEPEFNYVKKFDIAEEDNLVRDFQKETNTFINPEKQIKHEEKEWDLER